MRADLGFQQDSHSCVPCLKVSLICWNMDWQLFSNAGNTTLWNASLYADWMGPCRASAAALATASVRFFQEHRRRRV